MRDDHAAQRANSNMWQAVLRLKDGSPAPFAELMDDGSAGVSVFEAADGGWTITALYRGRPDEGILRAGVTLGAMAEGIEEPALELAPLRAADWLAEAYAGFPPRRIGSFYVYGSHVAEPPPAATIPLHIDAATAFGSGEHATTEGCLRALDRIRRAQRRLGRVLDMGTGSGILAIAAAKSWKMAEVYAVDIDAESARVAAENAGINGVATRIRVGHGDGYRAPLARTGPRFDLITANILARPLIRMAPALERRLRPGGMAVLSGLLARQANAVASAHRATGLRLVGRIPIGEWETLIFTRP